MKQTTNFNEYNIVGDDNSLTINNSSGSLVSFINGNIGIGTTSPARRLHISKTDGDNELVTLRIDNNLGYSEFGTQSNYARILSNGSLLYAGSLTATFFYLGNETIQTFKVVNSKGHVGIRNSNPTEILDVNGNIKADGILKLYDITDTQKIELNPDGDSYILNGNIGIGTTSPSARLHVSSSTGDSVIRMSSPAANTLAFNHYSSYSTLRDLTLNSNRILFFDTGKNNIPGFLGVGISGAEQPSTQLDVRSSTANTYPVKVQGANSNDIVKFYDSTVGGEMYMQDSTGTVDVKISTGASSYFNGGNVGIGTTNPTKNLHITDNEFTTIKLSSDTTGNTENDGTDLFLSGIDFVIHNRENGNIRFFTNLTERFKITNNGDIGIGIGSNNPTEKLDVNGNIKADGILKLYDITDTQKISLNPDGNSYINGGNLGIGTDNPYMRLHVGSGLVSTLLHNGKYLDTSASAKFVSDTPYVRNGILIGVNDGNRNSRLELYTKDDIAGNGEHGIRTGYSSGGQQPFRIYNNSSDAAFEIDSVGQRVKLPYYGLGNVTGTSTQILGVDSDGGILEESVDTFQRIEKLSGTLTNSFVTIKTFSLSTMDMYKMVVIGLGPDITLRQAALATYVARVEADGGVVESQDYVKVELGDLLDTTNYIRSYAEYLIYNEDGVGYALEELNSNLRSDQFAQPLININVDALQIKNGLNINNSTYRITLTKYD